MVFCSALYSRWESSWHVVSRAIPSAGSLPASSSRSLSTTSPGGTRSSITTSTTETCLSVRPRSVWPQPVDRLLPGAAPRHLAVPRRSPVAALAGRAVGLSRPRLPGDRVLFGTTARNMYGRRISVDDAGHWSTAQPHGLAGDAVDGRPDRARLAGVLALVRCPSGLLLATVDRRAPTAAEVAHGRSRADRDRASRDFLVGAVFRHCLDRSERGSASESWLCRSASASASSGTASTTSTGSSAGRCRTGSSPVSSSASTSASSA